MVDKSLTEQQEPPGPALLDSPDASVPDWKRRQQIQPRPPRPIVPTLQERVNRLPPQERHELRRIVRSKFLRATIRRALAEALYLGAPQLDVPLSQSTSMQRLRKTANTLASLQSYERALTGCDYSDPRNDEARKHIRVVEHAGATTTIHIDMR